MKVARIALQASAPERRGVALLMAFLVLMVVLAICAQLRLSTGSMQKSTSNETGMERMDLAIESSLLEVMDLLRTDAEDAAAASTTPGGAPAGAAAPPAVPPAAGAAAGGGQEEPVDSHEDSWGKPQRTEINQVELRVMVQDEDSKVNILGMLAENEDEAEKAFQRVVKILDTCRQGTTEDIDSSDAERMANGMREHLRKRAASVSPRTKLLSDNEDFPDLGLPLTLKEFASIEPFEPQHFREYRDDRGKWVHSIGSFLTVYTALRTGDSLVAPAAGALPPSGGANGASGSNAAGSSGSPQTQTNSSGNAASSSGNNSGQSGNTGGTSGASGTGAGQTGGATQPGASGSGAASASGIAVNVNTAPPCVLKALVDDREVSSRWLDSVIEYRNIEEKKEGEETEDAEPVYDEYGRVVIVRQVFDNLAELDQVAGVERLSGDGKAELLRLLTTQSQVFSIFVTARIVNPNDRGRNEMRGPPQPGEREDELGNALTLTVRAVVWRQSGEDGATIVPIVRWEVLDYTPFEVLDYPDDDR